MGFTDRREHTDRRQPRPSADDLHRRLKEKIAEIETERREGLRRQADQREGMPRRTLDYIARL